jgi:hypothetical protein
MLKHHRVSAADSRQLDYVTGEEADRVTADLRRPLIAIALYAVGFASLMLLINPFHLAEGSEWLLWLPHLARDAVETISELFHPIANTLF